MWNMASCAVQGRGHIAQDMPCQDKVFACTDGTFSYAALADGAGSAAYSHYGAEAAVQSLKDFFEELSSDGFLLDEEDETTLKEEIINRILDRLDLLAQDYDCGLDDLASTLLVIAEKDGRYALLHIGDGVIGCRRNGVLEVLSYPTNGEFVNETFFTTTDGCETLLTLKSGESAGIDAFFLMSDGTEAGLYNRRTRSLGVGLSKLADVTANRSPTAVSRMLEKLFESTMRKLTADDVSLVVMARGVCTKPYQQMTWLEKGELFGIAGDHLAQIRNADMIVRRLSESGGGLTAKEVAKIAGVDERHIEKKLAALVKRNVLLADGGVYFSAVDVSADET